jgi:tripartite ATP-independent transporter DctM subunit
VFQALVGHFRGGPAIATVLVCAFFTSFTGASGVTILALGGLLMPVLLAARYSEKDALGLLTGSGSIGLLFPPCLPIILYAIIANIEINDMFLGGILPGLLMVIAAAIWGVARSPKDSSANKKLFSWKEAGSALWEAKWELLMPVVACAALFSGYATAVEASAVTALYAFIVESLVYRDLSITRDLSRVMSECGLLVGAILLILGVALGFTGYLIQAQVPDHLITWVQASVHSPLVFLLALNLFLLIVGCLMDIFSAIVVVVPLMVPLGVAFGIDPVHLGIIFLANLELGYLTPPVGLNLFLAAYRFKEPMVKVYRDVLPFLYMQLISVLVITYVPFLSTGPLNLLNLK